MWFKYAPIAMRNVLTVLNFDQPFEEVYELAIWIKLFHMFRSISQSDFKVVQQVYRGQWALKMELKSSKQL